MNTFTAFDGARQERQFPKLSISAKDFANRVCDAMVRAPDVEIADALHNASRNVDNLLRGTVNDIRIGVCDHVEEYGGFVEAARHQIQIKRQSLYDLARKANGANYFEVEAWASKRFEQLLHAWFPDGEMMMRTGNFLMATPTDNGPVPAMLSVSPGSCQWDLNSEILSASIHDIGLVKLWALFQEVELYEAVNYWHDYISNNGGF
jgi:hypothetical protein